MDGARSDVETERKTDLAKSGIDILDPVLEAVWIEGAHVPNEDKVDEIADRFPLLFRPGMHEDHDLV